MIYVSVSSLELPSLFSRIPSQKKPAKLPGIVWNPCNTRYGSGKVPKRGDPSEGSTY